MPPQFVGYLQKKTFYRVLQLQKEIVEYYSNKNKECFARQRLYHVA